MTVTNPGGAGGLGLCEPCTADVQCGGAGDNCVRMGTSGDYFCFSGCSSDSECPSDYYCSISMYESIDGELARQCIPNDYTCVDVPPPPTCTDDYWEENDTRAVAATNPSLSEGTYSLVSCPDGVADDEDWFEIVLYKSTRTRS
jgi:hypothetical protein